MSKVNISSALCKARRLLELAVHSHSKGQRFESSQIHLFLITMQNLVPNNNH